MNRIDDRQESARRPCRAAVNGQAVTHSPDCGTDPRPKIAPRGDDTVRVLAADLYRRFILRKCVDRDIDVRIDGGGCRSGGSWNILALRLRHLAHEFLRIDVVRLRIQGVTPGAVCAGGRLCECRCRAHADEPGKSPNEYAENLYHALDPLSVNKTLSHKKPSVRSNVQRSFSRK